MDEQQKPPSQPDPAQQPGSGKGDENLTNQGNNAGRQESDTNRPSGTSAPKDSTGVNPKDPVDPESPHIPAP